jgi:Plasmid pRiA4b ORF-3-like protein
MSSRSFKSASTDIEPSFVLAISISQKRANITVFGRGKQVDRKFSPLPWNWAAAREIATISVMRVVDRIARIRIELNGIDPTIWRRVEVPLTTSLKGLHDVIQSVMPFENYHLFRFDIGDKRYGIPDREWDHVQETLDAKNIKIGVLVERGVSAFSYTYDFGDDWRHSISIENVIAADPTLDYPRFIDGSRRAPPEDVGGIPGFEEFLDAMTNPRHPEHQRLTKWYGGSFDPDDLDLPVIGDRIGKLARRRALGKAGYAKSRGPTH